MVVMVMVMMMMMMIHVVGVCLRLHGGIWSLGNHSMGLPERDFPHGRQGEVDGSGSMHSMGSQFHDCILVPCPGQVPPELGHIGVLCRVQSTCSRVRFSLRTRDQRHSHGGYGGRFRSPRDKSTGAACRGLSDAILHVAPCRDRSLQVRNNPFLRLLPTS